MSVSVKEDFNLFNKIRRGLSVFKQQIKFQAKYFLFLGDVVKYNFPNLVKPSIPISAEGQKCLDFFRKKGYFVFYENYEKLADRVEEQFFKKYKDGTIDPRLFQERKIIDLSKEDNKQVKRSGLTLNIFTTFNDPIWEPLVCNQDFIAILYNYFKRQPYYRNQLQITEDKFTDKVEERISSKFHLDSCFHQLSIMLMINDTDESHTHTKYAVGSHTKRRFKHDSDRYSYPDSWVEDNWPIHKLTGKKGTLLIMDAGNGFHKISEQPNSSRKMVFLNVTCGSHIQKQFSLDKFESISYLKNKPAYVKNIFRKVTL